MRLPYRLTNLFRFQWMKLKAWLPVYLMSQRPPKKFSALVDSEIHRKCEEHHEKLENRLQYLLGYTEAVEGRLKARIDKLESKFK